MNTHHTTAAETTLIYEVTSNGVARITLNRPEVRNAFDSQLILNLTAAFNHADQSSEVKVILLSSSGDHFSAGADLNWMKSMANASYDENLADARQLEKLMSTINQCCKPVVTKVRGSVFGGGIGLLSCSDIVIAENESRFALSEVKLGLSPATIAPFVIDAIGARPARRLFLTGEVFNAEKALSLGLISEIVDPDSINEVTNNIISMLLKNAPNALTQSKRLISKVSNSVKGQALTDYTCELIAALRVSEEGQEGLTAFLEKRSPVWPEQTNNDTPPSKAD
ncbi:enoyl-CoA hydratase-related protein [Alkalimarinus alittae]|uniref:Enoyl-CoA hydratase-related protein n=1 Tax=Alkalimarinus alittae TaxID=2961619 RepID=A0ABY6MXB8_9ALTE|nr:enoyl-CoA hydratase-related protein [Alkalimarinus alittae]UZE94466.1 enoyl-CoA hydratase-related protein [Alkalimarinus alittae]